MAEVSTSTWTVLNTTAIGLTISSMDRAWKHGQMGLNTRAHILMVRKMGKEHSSGQMGHALKGISKIIIYKEMGNTPEPMEENILEVEKKIKWRGRGRFPGQMEGSIRANI